MEADKVYDANIASGMELYKSIMIDFKALKILASKKINARRDPVKTYLKVR